MNYKYYRNSSFLDNELFAIKTDKKIFLMNSSGLTSKVDLKLYKFHTLIEIEEFHYIFSKEVREKLIEKIKKYISVTDMTYRGKFHKKLLEDLDELYKIEQEQESE